LPSFSWIINNLLSMESQSLILFFVIALVLVGGAIAFSTLVAPRSFNLVKSEPYECGIPSEGPAWIQFNVGYYLFAIIYLIFDVETVFLFPWAVVMKQIGLRAFIEIIIFFTILGLGLLYAWKKGALKWV
jgi:NADH-quinone oxidoreductase subunit A